MRIAALALMSSLAITPFAANATEVTSFALDNGMEVVVVENRRAPVVVSSAVTESLREELTNIISPMTIG